MESTAIAIFDQKNRTVKGTFLTTTGDYRYLEGIQKGEQLLLSCFDGEHAFLFKAQLGKNGALEGMFWSGRHWQQKWTAERNENISLGETPEATARRETVEEAGIAPQRLIPITSCYASPGACTDFFHCFLGLCDLPDDVAGHHGLKAETEDIRTHAMPFDTAMGLVESGAIRNAPLILMLLWLARHRDRLRADR